tara:strand:+ start:938 stop:1654 length:717 start_codon:yes stop_codon:yes gene_type:complete
MAVQDPTSILSKYGTEGLSAMSGLNPYAMAGSAILGGIEIIGGYRNLAKAKKMDDPSYMSGAGELQQQKARYGRLFDTGISTGQEDMMRERFRSNITGLQQKFKETARQGSSVFSRLAGLNINEGERAIQEADIQQRNMGLRGLGSTAESLTNIAMRDIGTAKDDKRNAIQAAGKAIASGYGGLASAANFMGMTRDTSGSGGGGYSGAGPAGTERPIWDKARQNDFRSLDGQSLEQTG